MRKLGVAGCVCGFSENLLQDTKREDVALHEEVGSAEKYVGMTQVKIIECIVILMQDEDEENLTCST